MLTVLGASPQAVVTAAAAAAMSGETVHLDATLSSTSPSILSGRHQVVMPDGSRHEVELVVGQNPDCEAIILFVTPQDLRQRAFEIAQNLGAVPTAYAPASIAGWATLVANRGVGNDLTGVFAGWPIVGDLANDHIAVSAIKRSLPCGGVTINAANQLTRVFHRWMPSLVPVTAQQAELTSTNVVFHGPLMLAHLTHLTNPELMSPRLFYRGPQLGTGTLFAEAVDVERLAIGRALGLDLHSALDTALTFYGDQGMAGASLTEALGSFAAFDRSLAPESFDHRYIDEDVVFGLAAWEFIGRRLGVATPATTAVVEALSIASRRNLRRLGDELAEAFTQTPRPRTPS